MAKKTWIKVKRGLLDPKHIDKLGQAWYLYLYILDQSDWETGTIKDWKDQYAADDLGKSIGLIREHRKHLQEEKYIKSEQGLHKQTITIHNWIDPRRYDGFVQNKIDGMENSESCEADDSDHDYPHGSGHGFNPPYENNASSSSHISHATCQGNAQISPIQRMVEVHFGISAITPNDVILMDELEKLGVTDNDVIGAVDWFKSQGKVARYFSSVVNPIKFQANKRIQSGSAKKIKIYHDIDGNEIEA